MSFWGKNDIWGQGQTGGNRQDRQKQSKKKKKTKSQNEVLGRDRDKTSFSKNKILGRRHVPKCILERDLNKKKLFLFFEKFLSLSQHCRLKQK